MHVITPRLTGHTVKSRGLESLRASRYDAARDDEKIQHN
jgi:hypothetical protein